MSASPAFDLDRFKLAQDRGGSFDAAMSELRSGRKTTHWIWWVFPQIADLGSSGTSVRYALAGREEACAYLADDMLRARLVEAVAAVHEHLLGPAGQRLDRLMGSEIDALKLVSSLTLFAEVAKSPAVRDLPDSSASMKPSSSPFRSPRACWTRSASTTVTTGTSRSRTISAVPSATFSPDAS